MLSVRISNECACVKDKQLWFSQVETYMYMNSFAILILVGCKKEQLVKMCDTVRALL